MNQDEMDSLSGKLLLAIPTMSDPYFSQTATLLCQHRIEGAMGLVVNQPTRLEMREVFDSLSLQAIEPVARRAAHYGGPVQPETGFLLHDKPLGGLQPEYEIQPGLFLSTSLDSMQCLSQLDDDTRWIFCLGYAGWNEGQLEQELAGDSWIVADTDAEGLFGVAPANILKQAAARSGINLDRLGAASGHA